MKKYHHCFRIQFKYNDSKKLSGHRHVLVSLGKDYSDNRLMNFGIGIKERYQCESAGGLRGKVTITCLSDKGFTPIEVEAGMQDYLKICDYMQGGGMKVKCAIRNWREHPELKEE